MKTQVMSLAINAVASRYAADLNVVDVVHSSLIYIIDPNGQIVKQLPFGVSGMEIADQMFELMELKIALQQNKAALGA